MDTENGNHESVTVRITFAAILASVGVAFISRLPQLLPGQQVIPWYESAFFWVGIAIVVLALLILIVPPKSWSKLRQSVLGFPTWLREMYIWYKYGPRCILERPEIAFKLYADEQSRIYSSKVCLTIVVPGKTAKYCPVQGSFSNMTFQLKQRHGMILLTAVLERNSLQPTDFVVNKRGKATFWMPVHWLPYNNPAMLFVEPQEAPYTWEIKNVRVYLDNLQKYRKLSRKGRVSNAEKTQP